MLSFHCQGYCITSHRELRLLLGFWFLETALRMMQSKHHSVCKRTFPLLPHWLSVYFASGQIVASQFRACVNNANMVLLILENIFFLFLLLSRQIATAWCHTGLDVEKQKHRNCIGKTNGLPTRQSVSLEGCAEKRGMMENIWGNGDGLMGQPLM